MLGEHPGVAVPELLEQPCRPLHIREQKRDSASGQFSHTQDDATATAPRPARRRGNCECQECTEGAAVIGTARANAELSDLGPQRDQRSSMSMSVTSPQPSKCFTWLPVMQKPARSYTFRARSLKSATSRITRLPGKRS
jgi:hypothetical protein